MKNFGEICANVGTLLQRSSDTSYQTDIGVWVNIAHDYLYRVYDYWPALQDVHNFTTVASTGDYFMPKRFEMPLRLFDLTNKKELRIRVEEEFFSSNISAIANSTTESAPTFFRMYGVSAVSKQIAATGDTTKVVSSSAGDTAVIRVEGFLDAAFTITGFENITLNGLTPVAGLTTFYKINHFSKSADTTGYITLQDSSSNTLGVLDAIDRVAYYKILKLGNIPSAANSMRMLFKKRCGKLVNSYDYPFMDADEFLTLEAYGYGLANEKDGIDKAQMAWQKSKDALGNLLQGAQNALGPSFQKKIASGILQGHRFIK